MPRMIRATHALTELDAWRRGWRPPPPEPEPAPRRRVRVVRRPAPKTSPPEPTKPVPPSPLDRARAVLGPPPARPARPRRVTGVTQSWGADDGLVDLMSLDL